MSPDGQPFEHWTYRLISGDTGLNAASLTLLNRLLAAGRLRAPRAWLSRRGLPASLRQALWLDFGAAMPLDGQPGTYVGMWLVEQTDRRVFAYGVAYPRATATIGGRALRDWPALDPQAAWVQALAERLATAVLDRPDAHRASPAGPSEHWILSQVEVALLRAALGEWRAALDAERLDAIQTEGCPTPEAFNDYGDGDATVQRNRLQAARAFPGYAGLLRTDRALRRAVIAGEPLQRALAAYFQVKLGTIARTRTLRQPLAPAARQALLARLDAWPAEYLPRAEADWAPCLALAERLAALADCLAVAPCHLLKPFRHGWRTGLHQLSQQTGTRLDPDAIFDMMQAAWHHGVRPALETWAKSHGVAADDVPFQPPADFFPLWFGRYGLARLMDLAGQWRAARIDFTLAQRPTAPDVATPLTWPAWIPAAHTRGSYRILELTTQTDLEDEGLRLAHCVGTYAGPCLLEGSGIYAVRDRFGQSCSTFQVQMTEAGSLLIQHHAQANTEPPDAERDLVARFVAKVLAAVPPARVRAVRAERAAIANAATAWLARLAELEDEGELLDAPSAEQTAVLARLTAPLHPAEARRLGIPAFVRQAGADWLPDLAQQRHDSEQGGAAANERHADNIQWRAAA